MARNYRRRGRRKFNLRRVRVASATPAGALASNDVTSAAITGVSTDLLRIVSVDFSYGLSDLGATSDDGQEFGLAHSDYTPAEIEACLEETGQMNPGDLLAREVGNRLVRTIGQMVGAPGTGAGLNFNNGMRVKTRLNWLLSTGDALSLWIRNSSGTVWTTGASIDTIGDMWVRDGR